MLIIPPRNCKIPHQLISAQIQQQFPYSSPYLEIKPTSFEFINRASPHRFCGVSLIRISYVKSCNPSTASRIEPNTPYAGLNHAQHGRPRTFTAISLHKQSSKGFILLISCRNEGQRIPEASSSRRVERIQGCGTSSCTRCPTVKEPQNRNSSNR